MMHLTRGYRWVPRELRTPGLLRRDWSVPITACEREEGAEQVEIYKVPENEKLIDCPDCLAWLNKGDNRLLVSKQDGGVEQWIRNHVNDREIFSTGVESGETHRLTEDELDDDEWGIG